MPGEAPLKAEGI